MKDRFGSTVYAQQSAMLVAKQFISSGKPDSAKASLTWLSEQTTDPGYQSLAKLRLASILAESKNYDAALALLNGSFPASFEGLVADRKGDLMSLKSDKTKAIAEYERAYRLLDARTEYRRLVEVKLNALGVDVQGQVQVAATAGK